MLLYSRAPYVYGDTNNNIEQKNSKYVVLVENAYTLVVYDLSTQNVNKKKFDFKLENVEVCPNYPFASFIGKYESTTSKNKQYRDNVYIIYDLEYNNFYKADKYFAINDGRWSSTGEFTYIDNTTSFYLIPTKYLRPYLESKLEKTKFVEISGHPNGFIFQVKWIGNNIIYASGISEMECWGFYDTEKEKNYLISCCGISNKGKYFSSCGEMRAPEKILGLMLSKAKNNELVEISKYLFEGILKE